MSKISGMSKISLHRTMVQKKRKSAREVDAPNLKRFRNDITELTNNHLVNVKHSPVKGKKNKSRKEKRTEKKFEKKQRRHAHYFRKPYIPEEEKKLKEKKKEKRKRKKKKKKREKIDQKIEEDEEENFRIQSMVEANKQEDKYIRQLEKQLNLNKRKSKSLPQSFVNDGLDYLLDIVDSDKLSNMLKEGTEDDLQFKDTVQLSSDEDDESSESQELSDNNDSQSDNTYDEESEADSERDVESDLPDELSSKSKSILKSQAKSGKATTSKSVKFDGENLDPISKVSDNEEYSSSVLETDLETFTEDIYGRVRDSAGNVIPSSTQAYRPPGRRANIETTASERENVTRIKRQLKGFVNRLSEANIKPISSQVEDVFKRNSRALTAQALIDIVMESCFATDPIPERIIMEQALLVAVLHSNIGSEIGAMFLQDIINKFQSTHNAECNYGEGKQLDNLLNLLCNLYNFKIIGSTIITDVLNKMVECFQERDIELILILLRTVGFTLRKDDPAALKSMIIKVQTKAADTDITQFTDPSRMKFLLEVFMAIKNNNMRKIPNYDPTHLDHLRKILHNYIKGPAEAPLQIGLQELINSDESGKWWLVGSAWSGRTTDPGNSATTPTSILADDNLLKIAQEQRMNTEIRKNIFCTIMSSEDYVDAFEKLLRLKLSAQQDREIVHVVIDTCLQQKVTNPYYNYLMQKLCDHNRRFMIAFQYSIWDQFKILSEFSLIKLTNLASLISHLLLSKSVTLSIFKVLEFGQMDKYVVKLIRIIMMKLLSEPVTSIEEVFSRIVEQPKLLHLREGLKIFLKHFLIKKNAKLKDSSFSDSVLLVEKILDGTHLKIKM